MSQLCSLTTVANRYAWPMPVRPLIAELTILVETAHTAAINLLAIRQQPPPPNLYDTSLISIRNILVQLTRIEKALDTWWSDPLKKELRAKLKRNLELDVEADASRKKMNDLHAICGRSREMISELRNKTGMFCRHTLNVSADDLEEGSLSRTVNVTLRSG
jgi:hypothetical protein